MNFGADLMTTMPDDRARAWVRVDRAALAANARTIATRSGARLLPMVKANGYGTGAVAAARALEALDPWGFGVATPEEGVELRASGITRPVVVFTPFLPAWRDALLAHDLRPVIGDPAALAAWAPTGRPFHVELDTGMARSGVRWDDPGGLDALRAGLRSAPAWEGVFTHFHSADTDPSSAEVQWERFTALVATLPARPPFVHAANSAGALRGPRWAGDLVRPGIFLYGGSAGPDLPSPREVVRLEARVAAVRRVPAGASASYGATWTAARETTVATLAIGYADGVHRALSNRGLAALGARAVPFAGRVTMDMTLLDCGDLPVRPGDVATLLGGAVPLDAQAARAGTIAYELLTALGPRLPRLDATGDPP